MTDDAKNLLRECLQYLYESAPAEVYDRITAHLAAPAPEPVAWIQPDHLQKAMKVPFMCRVEPMQRDDFAPIYAQPKG